MGLTDILPPSESAYEVRPAGMDVCERESAREDHSSLHNALREMWKRNSERRMFVESPNEKLLTSLPRDRMGMTGLRRLRASERLLFASTQGATCALCGDAIRLSFPLCDSTFSRP